MHKREPQHIAQRAQETSVNTGITLLTCRRLRTCCDDSSSFPCRITPTGREEECRRNEIGAAATSNHARWGSSNSAQHSCGLLWYLHVIQLGSGASRVLCRKLGHACEVLHICSQLSSQHS